MKKNEPLSESYYYILLCLAKGSNHGYGIMQMTAELSKGDVKIGSGTMYGATSNMVKKAFYSFTNDDKMLYSCEPWNHDQGLPFG